MADITFKVNNPITLKAGTGVSLSAEGKGFTQKQFDGSDRSNIRISIGQDVATTANVQFASVLLAPNTMTVGTGSENVLVFNDGRIVGDLHFDNNLLITENLTVIGPLTYKGFFTSSNFTANASNVTQSVNSGSTKFGTETDNHNQRFTGSFDITGSYNLNRLTDSITEISNDTSLTDESQTSFVTEYAAYNFLSNLAPTRDYLRKSFVHTGSFVNSSTSRFTAVTASAPLGFTETTENDFMFFINGMLIENDALTIQQNSSNLDLTLDTTSLGYSLSADDEVIGFGKFNN